ncbi:MAG: serine protein kinase RIO [Candidatus Altiarchaeota archaeon]|nr:serine protein kinase RIO [Candidatus Altiarchaeota archaeon]
MGVGDFLKRFDVSELKSEDRIDREDRKVLGGVFDRQTHLSLERLASKGVLTELLGIVSRGKEASIFHGRRGRRGVAVKIYSVEASDFRNMGKYIKGDPRFSGFRNRRQLVYEWAQKEFKNLSRVYGLVSCPEPIGVYNNVLVMGFIGKAGVPAPKIKDVELKRPEYCCDRVIEYVKVMYSKRLVHADLSEYNILYSGKPVLIDFSTGVLLEHPLSGEFLERDVRNVLKFFGRYGVKKDYNEVLSYVKNVK